MESPTCLDNFEEFREIQSIEGSNLSFSGEKMEIVGLSRRLLDIQTTIGSPPAGGGANFDANMVIILAALLCALICALGLNSIVRCALRCSRRFAFETPASRMAAAGMKKSALRRIPVVVYGSAAAGGERIVATDCAICLGEFADGEKVRVLPKCNHGFHVRCVDTWLVSHSSCPTCRRTLVDAPPASTAAAADGGGSIVAE